MILFSIQDDKMHLHYAISGVYLSVSDITVPPDVGF